MTIGPQKYLYPPSSKFIKLYFSGLICIIMSIREIILSLQVHSITTLNTLFKYNLMTFQIHEPLESTLGNNMP